MYDIEIANSQSLEVDLDFLQRVAERTLAEEQVARAEISIALVDDAEIHRLNRQFLEHDYATDVLSFLFEGEVIEPPGSDAAPRGAGMSLEGEIIISVETAARMARELGWSARGELALYLVHGLLHLAGYDDLTDDERPLMRARERELLTLWELAPPQEHSPAAEQGGTAREPSASAGAGS